MRVISRITDSVKRAAFSETRLVVATSMRRIIGTAGSGGGLTPQVTRQGNAEDCTTTIGVIDAERGVLSRREDARDRQAKSGVAGLAPPAGESREGLEDARSIFLWNPGT